MNFYIVVVGAGAFGISAALTASECGAKVALLEKGDKFGGAGMFGAQGLFAVEQGSKRSWSEVQPKRCLRGNHQLYSPFI